MRVTVIGTVKNEAAAIRPLLDSLVSQTRRPDEVVIVDGGSTDGTVEALQEYAQKKDLPLRVLEAPGSNISGGRNVAIQAGTGDIIASTDAGVRFERDWLENLVQPFQEAGDAPDVVCGFFVADPQSVFETALGATILPTVKEIRPERFLPSSRSVAFRRLAWEAVGGYPAWMSFSEDLLFDMALKNRDYRFAFAPKAVVWFRPRSNLAAFWRQYRNYAMGDGEGLLWTKRHIIRYGTYLVMTPILVLLGLLWNPWWWGLLILGMAVYLRRPYGRLGRMVSGLSRRDKISAYLWVPLIRVWGDLAKMVGYPMGLPRGFRQRARTQAYIQG
jgi:glycosyltransferase involved in cell wall biosynthesis